MLALIAAILGYSVTYVATEGNKQTYSSTFICVDGSTVSPTNICDGIPHCPDSSDEVGTLCRHIVCPTYMYRCTYGACVNRTARCNGVINCVDASDETVCDRNLDDSCSDKEFQCSTTHRQCIPLSEICNGYNDCTDGSDENATICRDYPCPEYTFRCSYGGCIHQEVLCDGIKDCVDGTDEDSNLCAAINCKGENCSQYKCRDEEFACKNRGQCLPADKTCDGIRHCADASDENAEMCKARECPKNWFRCAYGGCIRPELKCNRQRNCYDWSDEDESLCGITLPEGACRLPAAKAGIHYNVNGCSGCRPGEVVPELTRLYYTCDIGSSLQGPSTIYCQSSQWLPTFPACLGNQSEEITCPPISGASSAVKQCEAMWGPHEGWLPCDRALPTGTRVFLECPAFYERHSGSSSIMCLHDGTWNQVPLSCTPVCGIRGSTAGALIVNGWNVEREEALPWQATLFSHENGEWKFFCGGTLIAERVVITAGHCVWKTLANTVRVALGILSSDLKIAESNVQMHDVESIELQSAYQDYESNYGSDIALLILKRPVTINSIVRPVCIPWHSDAALVEAQKTEGFGLAAGMGLTENDTFSSVLRMTTMKIVSDEECREKQSRDFWKYLTYTSFCAGWANGTGVCNGDSGGGLVLQRPHSNIWEIHGVVSVSPRKLGTSTCDPNFYTIFTKVFMYTDWIRRILEDLPIISRPSDHDRQSNKDNIVV